MKLGEPVFAASPVPYYEHLKEEGLWLVEGKDGVFYLGPCTSSDPLPAEQVGKTQLCGWLVGMKYPKGQQPERDVWGRSECGQALITGMYRIDNGRWHGHILDPRNGHIYNANLWLEKNGSLKLRGYIGLPLFGETQIWTRYKGKKIEDSCHMVE